MTLDCQTTGASPTHGSILEICWSVATAKTPDAMDLESYLIEQEFLLPPRISKITGITDDDLEDANGSESVAKKLLKSIKRQKIQYCVIHFAKFEKSFLEDLFQSHLDMAFPTKYICTHEIAKRLYPDLPSRGIRALAGYFSNTIKEAKRAEDHVIATTSIWHHLVKELDQANIKSVKDLESWLANTSPAKREKRDYPLDKKIRLSMPKVPGIYKMLSKDKSVLYVGKAKSLHARVNSYFRGQKNRRQLHMEMLTQTFDISVTTTDTYLEAAILENEEIKRLSPTYNISLRDKKYQPVFYDRTFSEYAANYSDLHSIGPFSNKETLQPLINLYFALVENQDFENMLLQDVEAQIISEGFEIFSEEWELSLNNLSIRSLIAIGLVSLREDIEEDEDEDNEQAEADDEEQEWTPELISSVLLGICRHSARQYLRSKRLLKLASSQIFWKKAGKGNGWRYLKIENTKIAERESFKTARSIAKMIEPTFKQLSKINQASFDRLRILETEINRIRAEGREVRVYWLF